MKKLLSLVALLALTGSMAWSAPKLPDQGVYKIQNVYSKTYVKLQSNYLADITALTPEDASDLLVWYGERDENGEALLTTLSGDGGDMIATLDFIKGLIQELLEYKQQPTWFLEEMFQLHLVPTGDPDGSVYLCVDVPAIDDWDNIKAIILEAAGGQTAINYYITHMVPGNRHYMGIDYDGSFGYRLQAGTEEGTDIKFLMYNEPIEGGYCYVKTASPTDETPYLQRVHKLSNTVSLAQPHNSASAVFELGVTDKIRVSRLAVQGLDLAPLAGIVPGAYLALCPTNNTQAKFVYNNYALKLQLPDEGVDANAALQAAAGVLGTESALYQALAAHSEFFTDRGAIYFVHSDNDGITVANDDLYLQYGDDGKWQLEFLDTDANYFAPATEVEADGKFYTTFYAAIPYTILNPAGVKALRVLKVDADGIPTTEDIELTVIPAGGAVLLECATGNEADNMLMPVPSNDAQGISLLENPAGPLNTMLEGTLFDDDTANDTGVMATLQQGISFLPDSGISYMPANKAWANKERKTAITAVAADRTADDTLYDLMGRPVNGTPAPGIYIQGGKKVIR